MTAWILNDRLHKLGIQIGTGGGFLKKQPVRRLYLLLLVILSILAVIFLFQYLLPLILPFVFGYFLARIAHPIVSALSMKFRIPRGLGSLLVITSFLSICILILCLIVGSFTRQIYVALTNMSTYQQTFIEKSSGMCSIIEGWIGMSEGTVSDILNDKVVSLVEFIQTNVVPNRTEEAISFAGVCFDFGWDIIVVFLSAILLSKEYSEYKQEFENSAFYKEIHKVSGVLSDLGISYLKAQFILMCITSIICTTGFYFIGNHYAILIGVGIALFDAFPILGCGFILVPWAVILLIQSKMKQALILFATLMVSWLVRQLLEPKLVGNRIGIKPVYTLGAMYVGMKVYGAFGFLLGPLSLVVIKAIVNAGIEYLGGASEQ